MKKRKATSVDELSPEVWKKRKLDDIILRLCNSMYEQNITEKGTNGYILPFPSKSVLGISKNNRRLILNAIAAKVYVLLLNRIWPEVEKMFSRTTFGEINPQHYKFWLSIESLKEYVQKVLRQHYCSHISSKDLIHTQRKDGANTTCIRSL